MTPWNMLSKRCATALTFSYSASITELRKRKRGNTVASSSWTSRTMRVRFKVLPVLFAFRARGGENSATWRKFLYSLTRKLLELSRSPISSLGLFGAGMSFRIPDILIKSCPGSILKVVCFTGSFTSAPRMRIAIAPRVFRAPGAMRRVNSSVSTNRFVCGHLIGGTIFPGGGGGSSRRFSFAG